MNKYKTNAEVEARAAELTGLLKVKVTPFVFVNEDDQSLVVGFFKEPNRIQKMYAFDKLVTMPSQAGAELLDACIIKEESDPLIWAEAQDTDDYYIGACVKAVGLVRGAKDTFKKSGIETVKK